MKTLSLMLYMQHITGQLLIILLLKLFILKKIERPKRKLFFYWLANFFTVYKEHLISKEDRFYRSINLRERKSKKAVLDLFDFKGNSHSIMQ